MPSSKSNGEVIRLHHLADGMYRATVTMEKMLNHDENTENSSVDLLTSYMDTVERLTDLNVLEDLTIKERRSEILFVPLMQCLHLLMLNLNKLNASDEKSVKRLLERAVELWSADLATDDHAVALATLTILSASDKKDVEMF